MASSIPGGDNYGNRIELPAPAKRLQSRPPGDRFDDMNERLAKLEVLTGIIQKDVSLLQAEMKTVSTDIAVLKERVSHLPSKGWAVTVAITTISALSAIAILAPKLQAWFGIIPK